MYSKIIGTGSYLPRNRVSNRELESRVDTSDEWIKSRTGIEARHIAGDGESTSEMACLAARQAMDSAGVSNDDIDLIIVATTTPDAVFPSMACTVQAKLGIKQGAAFDAQAVRVLTEVATEALEKNNFQPEQLDWLIPHQANMRIINATATRIGVPSDKVVSTVSQHGNTSAASVPLALDVAVRDGRVKPGDLILLEGVGGGMTWGSIILKWH